jgi:hypothetical protein
MEGTHVFEPIAELAAVFDKRSLDGPDAVADNFAELREIWPAGATVAENVELLRITAGGCGPTAFAMAAALTEDEDTGNRYTAAVLLGLAERAYRLAIQAIKDRGSITPDPARLPGTQFAVAKMRAAIATMAAVLTRHTADALVPRFFVAGEAEQVISTAYGIVGASGTEVSTRIGQIWNDMKASAPPFNADLARELIGKAALGIDLNETPRWL